MDSDRPSPFGLQAQPADLNAAAGVLRAVERAHFGIERDDEHAVPPGALILSFEIYRDSYARRKLSAFDYYLRATDERCSGLAVSQHLSDGTPKGVHCAEPGAEAPLRPRFYWRIYKTALMGHFFVGVASAHFLQLLRARGFARALVDSIARLPNLERAPLEFCDNVDVNGTYVRGAFYGIV
eukprot:3916630-Prymnesium_polylepis.1